MRAGAVRKLVQRFSSFTQQFVAALERRVARWTALEQRLAVLASVLQDASYCPSPAIVLAAIPRNFAIITIIWTTSRFFIALLAWRLP